MLLLNPLLKVSAELSARQIQYEKTQELISEAERAFELIGRAIRMAAYRNIQSHQDFGGTKKKHSSEERYLELQKNTGYRGSDAMAIRHELSNGIDFDCIGNVLTKERTKNHLAFQGFLVNRQANLPKGVKANGGSLICQSLDRQGRIQNATLMNGVEQLLIDELPVPARSASNQRVFKVKLLMTDGAHTNIGLERIFATRNF
jgi:hypothetical protein